MSDLQTSRTTDAESVFLASLPVIDRIIATLGARHGLSVDDREEFGSWARTRLIEDDYAVLRKFASRSSLGTYLSVVLANLLRDFRNSRWGRWRASAAARRLGPRAVRLETLLYRDGHAVHEAVEILAAGGASPAELRSLAARIPPRTPAREVALDPARLVAKSPESADLIVRSAEERAERDLAERALDESLAALPAEDRIIVRMRFWDDFSVADIARILGLEQKPLYRRLEAIQAALGAALAQRGVTRALLVELLNPEGEG